MDASAWFGGDWQARVQVLRQDGERLFCRVRDDRAKSEHYGYMPVVSADGQPAPNSVERLLHEFELKDHLDDAWSLRPLELVRERGRTMLLVQHPGGQWLDRLIGAPLPIERFLRLAIGLSTALGLLHRSGLIHRNVKPANVLVDPATSRAWLSDFGIASRLPRERQSPEPPEILAGTLAYMSPEQTGRMNRSVDSRSDLYALGMMFYEMLTGGLPFTAANPMEWVHCHIARRPTSPSRRVESIPAPVSAITMKLLAKTAEDRYQTAAAVESDLRRCLSDWDRQGHIDLFAPGEHDIPDQLRIPERLYGRQEEIETLLAAFARIVAGGRTELVLVSGYSGIGKSAVVNELHKPLVPPRGLFASGKFDQYKRDIPYATLAQAFQSLIRPLLGKSDEDLRGWRDTLLEALEPNGRLVVDLVPGLEHIIGRQPPVPVLAPQDAQGRFHLVMRRFIGVFARPEHPLALFLDDLQWLDAATLDLLEDLLTRTDLKHLLLIGAYRDNEVDATHPMVRKLEELRRSGAVLSEISLGPLGRADLRQMLAHCLHCPPRRAAPLAKLIHEKTSGNPFFAIQFISTIADEGLMYFDHDQTRWSWDLERIHAKGYTDNVVDLVVGRLQRASAEARAFLERLACLGNSAEFDLFQMAYPDRAGAMHAGSWEAVRAGFVYRSGTSYRFLHDRVQEAAYSLIPHGQRAEVHLRIGTLLAAGTPPDRQEEAIFEIVNQLNRGTHLIDSSEERERVARWNLVAARRAKAATAYASALTYLRAGRALLSSTIWETDHALVFSIECLTTECELLTADMTSADSRLAMLSLQARSSHDRAVVTRLQLTLHTTMDRSERAIEVFLGYLRHGGTDWSPHPTRADVLAEYDRIWSLVGNRRVEDLFDLPLIADPAVLDLLDVFTEIVHPALFYDENLSSLAVCRMVSLSLEHGNCDASCFGYVWFAMFAGPRFDDYEDGFRFGQLGYDLVEKRGLTRYQARTYISFGTLVPWARHAMSGRELVRRAFDVAYRMGDLTFSAYSWHALITNFLTVGDALAHTQSEAETGLAFARNAGFGLVVENCAAQLALVRTLRGSTPRFGCFDDDDYDESEAERRLAGNPTLVLAEFFYWTRKLQARFFAGAYASAVEASHRARRLLWTATSQVETGDFRFFGALAHAAAWTAASDFERCAHREALADHYRQLQVWAKHCPANFENRVALVAAEMARIEGRLLDAEHLYETAIRSAHRHGFVHHAAVANEAAAGFHATRGFATIADAYLREAEDCYLRWGADGKVRQMRRLHPRLSAERQVASASTTLVAPVEQLDLATVIKVSQAISGEIVLDQLIDTLMRTALEHAGAERGLLILPMGDGFRIEAEATTRGDAVTVALAQAELGAEDLPESVFHYVARTKQTVLLHDAANDDAYATDDYIRTRRARSILCLPLLKQARLLGVLYLENHLSPYVFTPARTAVLELLASQAAVSLENTHLYGEIREREARVRRLFDSNIIGIFTWNLDGRILDANEALLRIVGYDSDDLKSGRMRWQDLMPNDRTPEDDALLADLRGTGIAPPFEAEYTTKSGAQVPVLIGAALFDAAPTEGVAFVVDLSDRRQAEEAARESERRYHEARAELAHANRIAAIGQLSASIAHEVNQPLSGIVTNAGTCLRMLTADPPNIEGARDTAHRTIRDANRAAEVIARLRALFARKDNTTEPVDLNEAAREVVALSTSELQRGRVALRTELADDIPIVEGNRVQLQQVILNLILNAADAMSGVEERPREMVIRTRRDAHDGVLVSVQDAGTGFGQHGTAKLFEAFYTTKPSGMGLGLSISRSIIETHRGRLSATSNEGPGVTFSFSVPGTSAP